MAFVRLFDLWCLLVVFVMSDCCYFYNFCLMVKSLYE